jgi:hypothetical protein
MESVIYQFHNEWKEIESYLQQLATGKMDLYQIQNIVNEFRSMVGELIKRNKDIELTTNELAADLEQMKLDKKNFTTTSSLRMRSPVYIFITTLNHLQQNYPKLNKN